MLNVFCSVGATAGTNCAVVKKHIEQTGSVDVLSLKSYLIGPPRVGKTTTLRRLTGKIVSPNKIVPSTGIENPLTVQLYRSSVLISEGWHSQELDEQCQTLISCIQNKSNSSSDSNDSQQNASSPESTESKLEASSKLSSSAETMRQTKSTHGTRSPSSTDSHFTSQPRTDPSAIQEDVISALILLANKSKPQDTCIQEILKNLKDLTFIHFVDIGGQPEFHETLPLLLHGHALNLLFFDMSRDLDSLYQVKYRGKDSDSPVDYESVFTVKEIIERALQSISSLKLPNSNHNKPAAILIGTHLDECSEAKVDALEKTVQKSFANFIKDSVLCSFKKLGENNPRYIHPVDNVSGDSSDIKWLREQIMTVVDNRFVFEKEPISTFLLHLTLRDQFDPTPGWCSLKKCIEIADRCGISEEDLLNKDGGILRYLHDKFGTILHYQKIQDKESELKISQRVIVNPNVIMRPPVELVVTAFGAEGSEHAEAKRIRHTGEIPHCLMEKACSPNKGQSSADKIPTDEIVELLKSRYILYENAQSADEEKVYFLPCLLSPDNNVDGESRDHSLLNSLTYPPVLLIPKKGYVPLGPFPATVVKLSQSSHWTLAETEISIQNAERNRFRNRIRFYFQLPQEKTLDIELRALSTHLEFHIRHDASCKPVNPRLIPECLRELRIFFDDVLLSFPHTQDWKWDFGFYCPHAIQSGQCPHPARCGTKDKPQDVRCSQRNCKNGPVDLEDKHKCWFTVSDSYT